MIKSIQNTKTFSNYFDFLRTNRSRNKSEKSFENRIRRFKLEGCYDFSNLTCDRKDYFSIQSTQNREEKNSKLSVEENVQEDGNRTLNNNEFNGDDNLISMFPSLTPQQIGSGLKENMEVLQPSLSMQLSDHVFQALTQLNNISTQLTNELMEALEKKSWFSCQFCEEYRDEVGMNKTSSSSCFCFEKEAIKNCLNDETTTSREKLLIFHQQQNFLKQQLQQFMKQY